jgi:glycosyltransferase involved in cell wall biosynthesis
MPVKVSVILLDWPCHKSSNALDSLSRQNIPRDQYELVLVEFYGRMVPEEMEKTDVVISCGQDGLYHKHVGYNVGLLHTKGQVIAICDNDAVFPSDFVASIIASFNLNFSNKPSSIVLIHDQQRTSEQYPKGPSDSDELQQYSWINSWSNVGACMSVRKIDAIRFGGFDEHVCFLGYFGGFYDLGRRLVNASISEVRHDWSTTLRYLAHPYLPASFDQSFSWKLWHTVAYPTIEHQRTSFEGRLLPFKENPGVHKLRMSLRRIGTVYKERHAAMVGLSGFSKGERLQLYLTVLWETCKVAIIKRNKWLFDVSKKALRRLIGPRAYGVLRSWWRFLRGLDVEDVVQIIECPLPIDEQTRVDAARD